MPVVALTLVTLPSVCSTAKAAEPEARKVTETAARMRVRMGFSPGRYGGIDTKFGAVEPRGLVRFSTAADALILQQDALPAIDIVCLAG
ncbi:hypothetical protein K32_43210 [Kaistia sp. 32K]|nr:hypothetical protein K32_43210 [Kaistia sp. 32K]